MRSSSCDFHPHFCQSGLYFMNGLLFFSIGKIKLHFLWSSSVSCGFAKFMLTLGSCVMLSMCDLKAEVAFHSWFWTFWTETYFECYNSISSFWKWKSRVLDKLHFYGKFVYLTININAIWQDKSSRKLTEVKVNFSFASQSTEKPFSICTKKN